MEFYFYLPFFLFLIGTYGIISGHKNLLLIIMSFELLLLSINLNFIFYTIYWYDVYGEIFSLFILTVAAAESAIGLAILVVYYRLNGLIITENICSLKG
jgi:NADH-quinone oxidoreductase subunit K